MSAMPDPADTDDCEPIYPRKRWDIPEPDPEAAGELAKQLGTSPVVGQMLLNRGFSPDRPDEARRFARPQLSDLLEPADVPGVAAAAERLALAVKNGEKIAIYGDYDVDGITASAILWHALTLLGADAGDVTTYVPHRVDEGYGLNAEAVHKLADAGAKVIVSVDCGVTAVEEATAAKSRGVDLIVTDHHEWKLNDDGSPLLPTDACAIVHPRLPPADGQTEYANPHLTGAGVAFKLAWETGKRLTGKEKVSAEMRSFLIEALALAALGTIADVAPLTGENRTIARFGLGGLTRTKLRGLRALIDSAGLGGQELDSYHVGFLLGPRLNAIGRMGHAAEAVKLLTSAGEGEARDIADGLEQQNRDRQATERKIVDQAVGLVRDAGYDRPGCPAIVVEAEGWHPGVVGIVASRLVDKFCRPAVVLAVNEDGTAAGSGRSVGKFHLAHALAGCDDLLESHGGHAMAAGVRLKAENVAAFRERFTDLAREQLSADDLVPCLRADAAVSLPQIDRPLVEELHRLGPFGNGNPKPTLVVRGLTVLSARSCGKTGDHLQLQLDDGRGTRIKAIAFGCGKLATELRGGDEVDVAGEASLNEWQGRVSVELNVKDLAPASKSKSSARR